MRKTTAVDLEEELAAIRLRNEQRAAAAIEKMGTTYSCHPANLVKPDPVRTRFMPAPAATARPAPVTLLRRKGEK